MKKYLFLLFITSPAFSIFSYTQDLTGIWRGYFIDDQRNQYRYEIQVEQTKKNSLSGVTYSYLDRRFYGKSSMTGNFTMTSGNTLIQELKTLELKISSGSVACIQKCLLTYVKSGKEEFLEGTYTSVFEKTDSLRGVLRGAECGGGKMYLRKVKTSDFYIEPFLRKRNSPDAEIPPVVKTNPPVVKPPVNNPTSKSTVVVQKNNNKPDPNKNNISIKPKTDSVKKTEASTVKTEPIKIITTKPAIVIPSVLKQRENSLLQTLTISDENVTVKLYDNGEIDGDTISVYLDNKLVLSKKGLTTSALTINLKMDESNPEHELVMVAENLGRIPPNTSLMIVTAGEKRFEVRITSTEQKNAMVRFKYVKPGRP